MRQPIGHELGRNWARIARFVHISCTIALRLCMNVHILVHERAWETLLMHPDRRIRDMFSVFAEHFAIEKDISRTIPSSFALRPMHFSTNHYAIRGRT